MPLDTMSSATQSFLIEVGHSGKTGYGSLQPSVIANSGNGDPACNETEERPPPDLHTSFPVNLKEVFELTNPNAEINASLLRSSNSEESPNIEYSAFVEKSNKHKEDGDILPKLSNHNEDESDQSAPGLFLWKSVQGKSDVPSLSTEAESWMKNGSVADEKLNSHSVINLSLGQERVSYRHPPQLDLSSTEQNEVSSINRHHPWPQVMEDNSNEEQPSNEQISGNIINDVCISEYPAHSKLPRSPTFNEQDQPINANHFGSWSFSSDRGRSILQPIVENSPESNYGKRDVSCQVDDASLSPENETGFQNCPIPLTKQNASPSERSIAQSMLSLSGEAEPAVNVVPHALVHDGIKPELYTQERNLIVEPRLKELSASRKSGSFHCHRCSKVFSDSRSLQRHVQVHAGARAYHCPVCNKGFMLKGDLTRHIRIHSGEKPFACEVCHRRFTLKGNLMQHFRTHAPVGKLQAM